MLRKLAIYWLLTILLVSCNALPTTATQAPASSLPQSSPTAIAQPGPGANEFQNPVIRGDFPDPFVLKVDGIYYAYATNASGKNVQVARSDNLVDWKQLPDAMPGLPKWAKLTGGLTWAPEVIQIENQFLLYFTTRDQESNKQCVGVAVSDAPEGKFKDASQQALVCQSDLGGTIDASPFRDGEQLYLLYKNDGNCCGIPTHIYIQQLTPDGLSLVGEPIDLIRNDQPWEGHVIEAPTMIKQDDRYYLFYSANDYAGLPYAVGYAICDSATGPCKKAAENPILASDVSEKPFVIGPGHQTLLQVGEQTWMIYHVWEMLPSGLRGQQRQVWMDRVNWQDGQPVLAGPNRQPQIRPLP